MQINYTIWTQLVNLIRIIIINKLNYFSLDFYLFASLEDFSLIKKQFSIF